MKQKRVLICDDDNLQYDLLAGTLSSSYDVRRSTDFRSVVDDIEKLKPVQLLILDLGFPQGEYVGQQCLPEVVRRFPNIKVIVRSDILTRSEKRDESLAIARELVTYPQVVGFLSTADAAARIVFEVDRALGTPRWLRDGEVWLLHLSDLQFGGSGLPDSADALATKIGEAIETFVSSEPDHGEPVGRKFPFLAVLTGDLTQHARPAEFDEACSFVERLSALLADRRSDMHGALGKSNVILVPGNHDVSWDISRAMNLWSEAGNILYKDGTENLRSGVEFLWHYSWRPFLEMRYSGSDEDPEWAWQPGYRIVNLKQQLNLLIACVNSSRWGVHHLLRSPWIPRDTWLEISKRLDKLDPDRTAARLLLVHHTLESETLENRLLLDPNEKESESLIAWLSRTCHFSAALTGHVHAMSAREVDTRSTRRKLIHIGAGTLRSDDRKEFRNPEFNLVRLMDLAPESNKFQRLIVYAFTWDVTRFSRYSAFDDGSRSWQDFDLVY